MQPDQQSGVEVRADYLLALLQHVRRDRDVRTHDSESHGGHPVRRRGSGLDVHDIREFVDGDAHRSVDPMVTARTGKLHVRTYHQENDQSVLLVADFRKPMLWGTRRRLRSVAAAEAVMLKGFEIIEGGGKAGLLAATNDGETYVAPRAGEQVLVRLASALEHAHAGALEAPGAVDSEGPGLDEVLMRAGRMAPRGCALCVATGLDNPGPAFLPTLEEMARKLQLILFIVTDSLQSAPPNRSLPFARADENDDEMRWGRIDPSLTQGDPFSAVAIAGSGARVQLIDTARDSPLFPAAMGQQSP